MSFAEIWRDFSMVWRYFGLAVLSGVLLTAYFYHGRHSSFKKRYRERYELSGQGGGPVTFRVVYDEPEPSSPQTRSMDDWPRYPFTIKCRPEWMDKLNEMDSGAGEEHQDVTTAEGVD